MIERDFIMRMLQEFLEAIAKVIHRKSVLKGEYPDYSEIQESYNKMYNQFFRMPASYFYETDKETILNNLMQEEYCESDMFAKMQIIAELLYQDGLIKKGFAEKSDLLEKALYLFDYIESKGNTYSWELNQKRIDIRKILYG